MDHSSKKSARAYASIASQLTNWGEEDGYDGMDADMNYVSKRQSGAFSPMAMANDPVSQKKNDGVRTPMGMNTGMDTSSAKSPYPSVGFGRFQKARTSPMATPAGTSRASTSAPVDTPMTEIRERNADSSAMKNATGSNMGTSPSFINSASLHLDADYRPYHDALITLLSTPGKDHSCNNASMLQYIERIMNSAYSRSAILGDNLHSTNTFTTGSQSSASSASLQNTKRQLEQEGHFWSLIAKLVEGPSTDSSKTSNDFLLFQTPSASSVERDIQSFIQNLVDNYGYLDPAAMATFLQQCFDEEDIHFEGEDGESTSVCIPTVVQRRQKILDWIQSCHNRSISSLDLNNVDSSRTGIGTNKENIMWKDTTEKLEQSKHSFLSTNTRNKHGSDKIQEIHPDAPFLIHDVANNPFYGNDNDKEMDLLHKCLMLMKSGRTSHAFELCNRMGQPWRAAAWDGNAAHGYIDMNVNSGMMIEVADEDSKMQNRTKVGNAQRALWKRTMWDASASLSNMIQSHENSGASTITSGSGSMVYEAAITAILADDTRTASCNPLLSKNWMDLVWIFYRGHQARFTEKIYHAHNNVRRSEAAGGSDAAKYPFEGTEFKTEEVAQLACTAEMSRVEEVVFLSRLLQQYSASDGQEDLKKGISAFLMGIQDVQDYLKGTIDMLIQVSEPNGQLKMSQEEYQPLTRFILHLVLFFDSFCDTGASERDGNLGGAFTADTFYSNVIAPRRNRLVLVYLQQLMQQKALWEFTSLYASLLSQDEVIAVCSDFWSTCITEEKDRRMMLRHAQEYFVDGLDLVILKDIIETTFGSVDVDVDPSECTLDVASWLGTEKASRDEKQFFDFELENLIHSNDVRKMHSIRWLCFYEEHYVDAIVYANMLMRNFLMKLSPSLRSEKEDIYDDWTDSVILYTAKVMQSRFLPQDIAQRVTASLRDGEPEIVEEHIAEYGALLQFFDAHNAYLSWKEFIDETSPIVPFVRDSRFAESSVESNVANNMEMMNYTKKKKDIAKRLIKTAEIAKDSLMKVLEYDEGWFNVEEYSNVHGSKIAAIDTTDDVTQRRNEMQVVRCKVLPAVVSLVFTVCHTTAHWLDEFTKDIYDSFGHNSVEVLSRVTDQAFFQANQITNPFQATTWHGMSLLLANTVASSDLKISESMSKDELNKCMNCLAETNVCLLVDQERIIDGDDDNL